METIINKIEKRFEEEVSREGHITVIDYKIKNVTEESFETEVILRVPGNRGFVKESAYYMLFYVLRSIYNPESDGYIEYKGRRYTTGLGDIEKQLSGFDWDTEKYKDVFKWDELEDKQIIITLETKVLNS